MAVVTFSNIKGGGGGAPSGITFLNSDYTLEFIESAVTEAVDSAMTGYTRTEDFATINGSAITEGGNIEIETGGNYSAGTNIDITDDVISVTGITVPTKVSDLENDEGYITGITSGDVTDALGFTPISGVDLSDYYTSAQTNTAIENAVSGKMDTSAMSAYSTTEQVNEAILSAKTEVEAEIPSKVSDLQNDLNFVNSGDVQTQIDNSISGKADSSALTEYYTSAQTNTAIENAVSGKADASSLTAYTPTSGFSTINGSAITDGSQIVIEGAVYSAGTNINIDKDNVISVTGITVPTKVSDLENDEGFITTADTQDFVTSGDVATQINDATSGLASTTYVDNSVSGKADISSLSAYTTSADVETQITEKGYVTSGEVETQITDKGYITGYTETDPVFQASPASGISAQDILDWDAKLDSSDLDPYYTSAQTDTAISNAVSGKVDTSAMTEYYTSAQTDTQIANAVSRKQDTLISGTNIKTINNESILGSGNIVISGGSGGSANIIELTQAEYDALTAYTPDAMYVITDAEEIDLNDYMKVPSSGGSINSILMNSGSQRPIWSSYKFVFISQTDYNNLQTKDATTIYFIV